MTQTEALSNPYVAGSPISRPEMFFGRSDVFEFVRNALVGKHQDNVLVLYGKRRTGKTSVLYQMHRNIENRYLPILIDLQALTMDSISGFFWEVASTIRRALNREYQIEVPRPRREDFESDPLQGFQETFLSVVAEAIGNRRLLLMFDEAARLDEQVQAGKLSPDVFGHIRSLMQQVTNLNFLFCVGERLERMQTQYALLFNIALYKEISFLDRKAAEDLIARPVEGIYSYDYATIDRIIDITSGHAYFLQLLCHSLFARWQTEHNSEVTVDDVDSVTAEVVERGAANLKFDWDEAKPVEKLLMASMADALAGEAKTIKLNEVDEKLKKYDILVPQGELVSSHRNLIGNELVIGAEDLRFTIDFMRLWVGQHQRVEWVKEELAPQVDELRVMAEAQAEAIAKRTISKRFPWQAIVGGLTLIWLVLLLAPGSPIGLFDSSSSASDVPSIAQNITLEDKCGFQSQAEGLATLATCIDSVQRFSDDSMRLFVHWAADINSDRFNAVERGKSQVGDSVPYLEDSEGNLYNFIDIGEAAALTVSIRDGTISDSGWFLFPPAKGGSNTFTYVDVDSVSGEELRIERIPIP